MTKLLVKFINIAAVAVLLVFYNFILMQRTANEEIARLQFELHQYQLLSQESEDASADSPYADGIYTGAARGYAGDITVQVTVENGRISQVEVLSAPMEDTIYLMLAQSVTDQIVDLQTPEVDAVSGASFSSAGIIQAAKLALEDALK